MRSCSRRPFRRLQRCRQAPAKGDSIAPGAGRGGRCSVGVPPPAVVAAARRRRREAVAAAGAAQRRRRLRLDAAQAAAAAAAAAAHTGAQRRRRVAVAWRRGQQRAAAVVRCVSPRQRLCTQRSAARHAHFPWLQSPRPWRRERRPQPPCERNGASKKVARASVAGHRAWRRRASPAPQRGLYTSLAAVEEASADVGSSEPSRCGQGRAREGRRAHACGAWGHGSGLGPQAPHTSQGPSCWESARRARRPRVQPPTCARSRPLPHASLLAPLLHAPRSPRWACPARPRCRCAPARPSCSCRARTCPGACAAACSRRRRKAGCPCARRPRR